MRTGKGHNSITICALQYTTWTENQGSCTVVHFQNEWQGRKPCQHCPEG